MNLLERERCLQLVEAAYADVSGGAGRAVLINGEAGIGKTALATQFVHARRHNVRVLWGSCDALFTFGDESCTNSTQRAIVVMQNERRNRCR